MTDLLPVKSFQENLHKSMCGPASLKMVLDYYGEDKSEADLAELCGTNDDLGTNDLGIQKAAQSLGFVVEIKNNSTFEDIQKWLDKKVPVIVNWMTTGRKDYSESEVADGHYSVVVGLDEEFIYLQDPEIGELRKIKKDNFIKVWYDFEGKTIKPEELIVQQLIAIYKN